MKIFVGMTSAGRIQALTAQSLLMLAQMDTRDLAKTWGEQDEVEFTFDEIAIGSYIHQNVKGLAQRFLLSDCDVFLRIDDDMIFGEGWVWYFLESLRQLLKTWRLPLVLGGVYPHRKRTVRYTPMLVPWDYPIAPPLECKGPHGGWSMNQGDYAPLIREGYAAGALIRAHMVGGGFCAYNRLAIEIGPEVLFVDPLAHGWGEDYGSCAAVCKAGGQVYAKFGCSEGDLGHVVEGVDLVTLSDSLQLMKGADDPLRDCGLASMNQTDGAQLGGIK